MTAVVNIGDDVTLHGLRICPDLDSVMYTLSSFRRRLHLGDVHRDVEIAAGGAHWVPAQEHAGENIGDTATHTIFVELKEPARAPVPAAGIGPSTA